MIENDDAKWLSGWLAALSFILVSVCSYVAFGWAKTGLIIGLALMAWALRLFKP